jgi:hypothetical protein
MWWSPLLEDEGISLTASITPFNSCKQYKIPKTLWNEFLLLFETPGWVFSILTRVKEADLVSIGIVEI